MTELYDEEGNWVSKTQRKKECTDMTEMGEKLISLNHDELAQIQMDDELRAAIEEAQRIKSYGALKRQKQFIGKIIRNIDADEISIQLDKILHKHDMHNAEFKRMEKWRDNLVENGDVAINSFLEAYPNADRHHLRQLVRNVEREKKASKPPTSYRQIFKYIREIAELSD